MADLIRTDDDRKLHMFESELPEWVIAYDTEDAIRIWCKETGCVRAEFFENGDRFRQLPDEKVLKFWLEDGRLSDSGTLTPMTCAEAIAKWGHGFYASSEF